jgi:acyl-coenzyme A synthetase/AMP-(fatty) acid ligase/3-hydroxymyristoyl/3-hydroxydecanoyl-(acyl carrier protein) dehydratase
MPEIFNTNKYDNRLIIVDGDKQYTYGDIKEQIAWQIENLKNKKDNVVIVSGSNYGFIVHFFASLYSKKNVYLLADKTKLNDINLDFDILEGKEFGRIKDYKFPELDTKKAVFKFFTSGSTGTPKTIEKSLYNLIAEGDDVLDEFNLKNKNYNVITTTTMCHSFCLSCFIMFFLFDRFVLHTKDISYPDNIDVDNSILITTPSFLSSIPKYNIQFGITPKYIFSAGSKLDDTTFNYLKKITNIIDTYGCTEVGLISYKTSPDEAGKLYKSVNLNVYDDYMEVISPYSYFDKIRINDKVELNGRNIIIKNRTDRLYKICDKPVSAEELENKLKENEFVKNCYIIKSSEKLACLCALSEEGKEFFLNNDISLLTKKLKQYMLKSSEIIPQRWKYIDEIPMTNTGKVNKTLIEKIFSVNSSLPLILDREISQNSITYKMYFYNKCNFFDGHFPKYKIVPGVVQLYFAKEFSNVHFGVNIKEGQWKRIKFSNIIEPDKILYLKLIKDKKNVSYEYYSDEKKYSSGVFSCENVFKDVKNEYISNRV